MRDSPNGILSLAFLAIYDDVLKHLNIHNMCM